MSLPDRARAAQAILITDIEIAKRLRGLRPEVVDQLAGSMEHMGQLEPILVRPGHVKKYLLVAGAHRVEARKKMGGSTILAVVTAMVDADDAELVEIDENLIRADLSPAERALHLARRKVLYEQQHPETKPTSKGGPGRGKKGPAALRVLLPDGDPGQDVIDRWRKRLCGKEDKRTLIERLHHETANGGTAMRWTNTVETVVEVEASQAKGQWKIGDAIAKDLDLTAAVKKGEVYAECANVLEQKGFDKYTPQYLRILHCTAEAYPRSERDDRYSWDAHKEAGTPDNLKQAVAALRKLNKTITIYNVRWLMAGWREKASEERRRENEAARREEAAAKNEAAKAAERALAAKNKADKEKAKKDRDEAKQKAKQANQRKKKTSKTPKYNEDVKSDLQDESTLRAMALYFGITMHAKKMQAEANKALMDLDKIAEHLTPVQIKEINDAYQQVIVICQQIKSKASGKPNLRSVTGGAA
jgi:ParB-like nuclease domain